VAQAGIAGLLLFALYLARAGVEPGGAGDLRRPTTGRTPAPPSPTTGGTAAAPTTSDSGLVAAFRARRSNVAVFAAGRVARVLPDDRTGSPHQRFIVRVGGGPTVLVAHNLDLAPRVPLAVGDSVELRGEYEWNDRGGVIHWTHRDPAGRHTAGWIRYHGRLYQ
jgi:hypothetical protein